SWVKQGCKTVNRNLSMTEWNELARRGFTEKEPAGACAGKGASEGTPAAHLLATLAVSCGQEGERRHSLTPTRQQSNGTSRVRTAGGLRLMCRSRQDDRGTVPPPP